MPAYNPPKAVLVETAFLQPLEAAPYVAAARADQEDQEDQTAVALSHDLPFAVLENDEPEAASDEFVAAGAVAAVAAGAGVAAAAVVVAVEPVAEPAAAAGLTDVVAEDGPFAERSIHSTILHQHP